jgi:SAM-dependent methyltransferase
MAESKCPLCGSRRHRYVFSERGYGVRQCDECELFFIDPYPDDQSQFHTVSDYNYDDLQIVSPERHYRGSHLFYGQYFPVIRQEIAGAKRVLDVGCGTGHLLELLGADKSLDRAGLELNKERAEFARGKARCDVFEVPIEDFQSDEPFDAIFLMNVLSHVPDIEGLFTALRRLLSANGKVLFKVGELTREVKKHAVHDWDIPDHLHFLGMKTMEVICRKYGFKISRHDRWPLSSELFDRSTWTAQGRSAMRNAIKRVVVSIPFSLPLLARVYDLIHGRSFYTSFISLQLDPAWKPQEELAGRTA